MKDIDSGLKDITEIRSMMERSSKFISLSGLSGVGAGLVGLLGWGWLRWYLDSRFGPGSDGVLNSRDILNVMLASVLVLLGAVGAAMFFSWRLARRQNLPLWNATARETVAALLVPLGSGGLFSLILMRQSLYGMIPSAMLIFYGMALVSAGKFTLHEIRLLGLCEIALGLIAAWQPDLTLWLWATGFGFLHIIYGITMYAKYEK